jgi:Cu+-exporting ATPase
LSANLADEIAGEFALRSSSENTESVSPFRRRRFLPPTIISRAQFYTVISLWIREKLPTDPVCGAVLDERTSKYKITYEGDTYHFCCVTCKKRFKRHPMKFLK